MESPIKEKLLPELATQTFDFTVLIQGPLNLRSIEKIEHYRKSAQVVLSYWEPVNEEEVKLEEAAQAKLGPGDIAVKELLPTNDGIRGVIWRTNFFYAIKSTYNGIAVCKTPYVIKTRSDEFFLNFSELKRVFLEDNQKLVCGNILARTDQHRHIGDHLFVARTDTLHKGYKLLVDMYTGEIELDAAFDQNVKSWRNGPEGIVAKAFMLSVTENIRAVDFTNQHLIEHIDMVDINKLGEYFVVWQGQGLSWKTGEYPNGLHSAYRCKTWKPK